MFGGAVFRLAVVPRQVDLDASAARTLSIMRAATLVAALSGITWLVATMANITGDVADLDRDTLHAFFLETAFGPHEIARLVLLAALVAFVRAPMSARLRLPAIASTSGLLLVGQAWLGHAAENGGTLRGTVMIVCYAAHVLAGAAWIGSLPWLLLAVVDGRGRPDAAGLRSLLLRYGRLAATAAGVVIVSGVANMAFHAGFSPRALLTQPYGQILAGKITIVAAVLMLAGANRFVLMPALARGATDGVRTLARSIGIEGLLALLVLGGAAVLGVLPPLR